MRRRAVRTVLVSGTAALLLSSGFTTVPAVAAQGPDLRVASVSPAKTTVEPGASLRVKVKVRNAGNRPARASRTRFLLSKNKRLNRNDRVLTTVRTAKLRGKRARSLTRTVRIPTNTRPGAWHLLVCADATAKVRETREKNNCRATKRKIKVTTPRPDLTVTAATVRTARVTTGGQVQVEATVRNQGRAAAKATATRFHLSRDAVLDGTDHELGGRSTPGLASGKSTSVSGSFTVGSTVPSGNYHLLACTDADQKVPETNEKNNCRASTSKVTVAVPSDGSGLVFPLAASPIDVAYETERVVQRSEIEFQGPSFSTIYKVTGSDGTHYELSVPMGAVYGESAIVDIQMRPVTSIDGSPLGEQVGAVELLPHGLVLMKPATLTITPVDGVPSNVRPFKFAVGGKDFHPHPGGWTDRSVSMELTSFSTAGVATATPAQSAAAFEAVPAAPRAQLQAQAAKAQAESSSGGSPDLTIEQMYDIYVDYYKTYLEPQIPAAKTDTRLARIIASELLQVYRDLLLVGLEHLIEDPFPHVMEMMFGAIDTAARECRSDHKVGYVLDLLSLSRSMALLGYEEQSDRALDEVLGCLRWEVDFVSEVEDKQSWPDAPPYWFGSTHDRDLAVSSTVPVELVDLLNVFPSGEAPLDYDRSIYTGLETYTDQGPESCRNYTIATSLQGTTPGTAKARIQIDLNAYEQMDEMPGTFEVGRQNRLILDVGDSTESPTEQVTRTHSCNGPSTGNARTWQYVMHRLYSRDVEEYRDGEFDIRFGAGDQAADVMATRSWDSAEPYACTSCTGGISAYTTLVLRHVPHP